MNKLQFSVCFEILPELHGLTHIFFRIQTVLKPATLLPFHPFSTYYVLKDLNEKTKIETHYIKNLLIFSRNLCLIFYVT